MVRALALSLTLAWGAMAFGAVYDWALWVLAIAVGVIALPQVAKLRLPSSAIWWAALGVVAAVVAQLIPLPEPILARISPAAPQFLSVFDVAFANGTASSHSLSVNAHQTTKGMVFLLFGGAWIASNLALMRRSSVVRTLAPQLVGLGIMLALVGLAQKATFNGKILWFWTPTFTATNAFGPFVNRNHFAGWMMLVIAVSVGYLFGRLRRVSLPKDAGWRRRLRHVDSGDFSSILVTAVGILVMLCSVLWTMSRSGIAGTMVALTIMAVAAVARFRGSGSKAAVVLYVLTVAVGGIAWRGADTLFNWYGNTYTLFLRFDLWKDTLTPLRDFWITGSGFNTYGSVMRVYPRTFTLYFPREAHNDYLQLAVEGGLLVGVPALLLAAAVSRGIVRRLRQPQDEMTWWIRLGAVAAVCGMAVQELTEFSLQIPGVALLFATCIAIAIHEPSTASVRKRAVRSVEQLVTEL